MTRYRAIVVLVGVCSLSVYAHSINLFANYEGEILKGRAYSGNHGLANATVHITDTNHHELATVTTDEDGHFSFKPPKRMALECRLAMADGHSKLIEVAVNDSPNLPIASQHGDLESLRNQVHHLQEEVHELGHKTRVRDVVGGLGYIIGLAGVVMILKTKKQARD